MPSIFIALGSNIDPENNLKAAVTMLRMQYGTLRFSSVYKSAPLHHTEQDEFLNAVAGFESDHSPEQIFAHLQSIEHLLGKNPPFRFGPRTIDLDLLLHGDTVLPEHSAWLERSAKDEESVQLLLPHPRMHMRRFVLEPLCEIAEPGRKHPVLEKTWEELLSENKNQGTTPMPNVL